MVIRAAALLAALAFSSAFALAATDQPPAQSAPLDLVAPAAPAATSDEDGITYGASVGFFTQYVSRGLVISNEPVLQPELSLGWHGWRLGVWNNVDLTDGNVAPWRLIETDWTLSYGRRAGQFDLEAGYIYYTFPNLHVDDTQEVYGAATLDTFLAPTVEVYYDFDEVGGTYSTFAVSHCVPLGFQVKGSDVGVNLLAGVGYGDANYLAGCFDCNHAGFVDLLLSAELPMYLGSGWSVVPSLNYMQVLDRDLREQTAPSDALFGGLSLATEF